MLMSFASRDYCRRSIDLMKRADVFSAIKQKLPEGKMLSGFLFAEANEKGLQIVRL